MNWKPIYALLIFSSTIVTFGCGKLIERNKDDRKKAKIYLIISLVISFSLLFFFKYYNFINESVFDVLSWLGIRWTVPNLDILLPVGISFYTFQAAGYSIDIYRGQIKAERHFGIYALFVSFFPQLVAGPIERAKQLMPQFYEKHAFNYSNINSGLKLMLWGYFMKLCVADRVAPYVNAVFNNIEFHNGNSLSLASFLFAFQIYGDFAGYSLIAVGCAKIIGFRLTYNFNRPYFSKSISEFWRRWHISLSQWLRDYIYIPLGGSRVNIPRHLMNLLITFIISGIWHGANWTFFIWGLLHGAFLIVAILKNRYLPKIQVNNNIRNFVNIIVTFILAAFAFIFFRANSVQDAFEIIRKIIFERGNLFFDLNLFVLAFLSLSILIGKEIKDEYNLKIKFMNSKYSFVRYMSILFLLVYIMLVGVLEGGEFIYFQF